MSESSNALVAELADAQGLGPCGVTRESSTLSQGTFAIYEKISYHCSGVLAEITDLPLYYSFVPVRGDRGNYCADFDVECCI